MAFDLQVLILTEVLYLLGELVPKKQIALFNDAPVPSGVTRLRILAGEQDTVNLHFPRRSNGTPGVWVDFDALIDMYFWDTDFLMDVRLLDHLTPEAKSQLGLSGEVVGVTHALTPHPDELILKRWQEGGSDDAKGRESSDGD